MTPDLPVSLSSPPLRNSIDMKAETDLSEGTTADFASVFQDDLPRRGAVGLRVETAVPQVDSEAGETPEASDSEVAVPTQETEFAEEKVISDDGEQVTLSMPTSTLNIASVGNDETMPRPDENRSGASHTKSTRPDGSASTDHAPSIPDLRRGHIAEAHRVRTPSRPSKETLTPTRHSTDLRAILPDSPVVPQTPKQHTPASPAPVAEIRPARPASRQDNPVRTSPLPARPTDENALPLTSSIEPVSSQQPTVKSSAQAALRPPITTPARVEAKDLPVNKPTQSQNEMNQAFRTHRVESTAHPVTSERHNAIYSSETRQATIHTLTSKDRPAKAASSSPHAPDGTRTTELKAATHTASRPVAISLARQDGVPVTTDAPLSLPTPAVVEYGSSRAPTSSDQTPRPIGHTSQPVSPPASAPEVADKPGFDADHSKPAAPASPVIARRRVSVDPPKPANSLRTVTPSPAAALPAAQDQPLPTPLRLTSVPPDPIGNAATPRGIPAPPPAPPVPSFDLRRALDPVSGEIAADLRHDLLRDPAAAPVQMQSRVIVPPPSDLAARVAEQMAQIARQLPGGPVEIALNPEELGRVRMQMTTGEAGLTLLVLADRPETLDLLRRHIDILAQEYRALGYASLEFAFGQQGAGGHQGRQAAASTPTSEIRAEPTAPAPAHLPTGSSHGIDIRI